METKSIRHGRREFTTLLSGSIGAGLLATPLLSYFAITGETKNDRLVNAIKAGDLDEVKSLLNREPKLASNKDKSGRSMFVLAHIHHQQQIADEILKHAPVSDVVECVLANDKDRFVQLAKDDPACVNSNHAIGGNAYYAAARFGKLDMIWPLNRWGGNPNVGDAKGAGITALRAAFENPNKETAAAVASRILIDAGDPTVKQPDNDTVLHAAARLGNVELIKLVIRRGGKTDIKNKRGKTPLDVAIESKHENAIAVLRNHQQIARTNWSSRFVFDTEGAHYSKPQQLKATQIVINHFAEVCHFNFAEAKRIYNQHPDVIHGIASWNELGVEACAHMERPTWTRYFLDQGAPMSLSTALAVNDVKSARRLLEEDKNRIHERGPHDFALMWYPQIAGGHVELAELLLEFGADIDEEKLGTTCLHKAALNGQKDLVAFLIEKGAKINAIGKSDFSNLTGTPLDWAVSRKQIETVQLLRSHGAKPMNPSRLP